MKTIKNTFTSTISHQPLYILMLLMVIFIGCSTKEYNEQTSGGVKDYWTCTMHPQVHKDGPGACPICGMDLIKKVVEDLAEESDMEGMLTLTSNKQVLANVSTIKIKIERLSKELSAYSYLDFVEQNRKTIPAKFNGRIEKLFVNKTGDYVKKGEALFEIYSPDIVQAQNDYLIALSSNNNHFLELIESSIKKLELLGLTSIQIEDIKHSGQASLTLTYYSPVSGTVIEKKVQEGMYVNEGTAIYELAELSTLWNIAEVNESDLSAIKIGSKVKLKLKAYPGEEFAGKVTFIYPVINPQTRTVKVRSEFPGLNSKLKPQMYGETIFYSDAGLGLAIPADAIIFSGNRNVVWVKTSDGMFEAHKVEIGQKFGEKYQVLSGLNEGDEVAASGGFLIDSESQLKTGMSTGHQHGDELTPSEQQKSSSDSMEGMNMPK
ncbi:MAG: efflux RND transporter periplasmic adaptor subunit [Ignavibacteria bacterium]|nr:efflux RND transporter periplasmic adaptor subunit [Ignavibacteria bacterium]